MCFNIFFYFKILFYRYCFTTLFAMYLQCKYFKTKTVLYLGKVIYIKSIRIGVLKGHINLISTYNRLNQGARLLVVTSTSTPIPVVISKLKRGIGMIADLQEQVNLLISLSCYWKCPKSERN